MSDPGFPTEFVIPAGLAHDIYSYLRQIARWQIEVADDAAEAEGIRLFEELGQAMFPHS